MNALNHYCTLFNVAYAAQGLALAESLQHTDPTGKLFVLAMDEGVEEILVALRRPNVVCISLDALERHFPELARAKTDRTRVEYFYTLSPFLPLYLLRENSGVSRITYVDADMYFFASPEEMFIEMGEGSIYVVEHRFPEHLRHQESHGRFNVGVLSFRRDASALACLRWWADRCVEWCHAWLEGDRYADQKYLDQWPARFSGVVMSRHPGVNLAPWNWINFHYHAAGERLLVNGYPLVVFHFARFRPLLGHLVFSSGQRQYGVMPHALRNWIYRRYWLALVRALTELERARPASVAPLRMQVARADIVEHLPSRLIFGSDWVWVGGEFFSGRFGFGQYSGRVLAEMKRLKNRWRRSVRTDATAPLSSP
ncbi:MAG: hypothetical protein HYV96_14395 [Opitutae bacterium]|nr:hypothetical protein [Opitutae bacterium]